MDDLGDRIKNNYENRTRYFLPRRTYTIIRLDGKAFHTFTKQFEKPYDLKLMEIMDLTAKSLCREIQGAKFAFVQSDEINILVTDFEKLGTDAWFNGNLQKIVSVSASIATCTFNKHYLGWRLANTKKDDNEAVLEAYAYAAECVPAAHFDSRAFTITDRQEVKNVFIWRQQDATKNAIQMLAQHHFSHKELQNLNESQLQDKLMLEKQINFNDEPVGFKRGRFISRVPRIIKEKTLPNGKVIPEHTRNVWESLEPPILTKDKAFLDNLIPNIN